MGRAERTVQDKYVATVRAELGDEAFASAWSAGARMSMDQLIQEALSISAGALAHA
jgi:hypothetical protein